MSSVQGIESRRKVYQTLMAYYQGQGFLKDLFTSSLQEGDGPRSQNNSRDSRDIALIHEICYGVLRNQSLLDYNLRTLVERFPKETELIILFRLGLYQLYFLDQVPAFAIVNTCVEIAKEQGLKRQSGFLNAVLKKASSRELAFPKGKKAPDLAIRYSHPLWMVERWIARLGIEQCSTLLQKNNEVPGNWVRLNVAKAESQEILSLLQNAGIEVEPHPDFPFHYRLISSSDLALRSECFSKGLFSFQDPASHLVCALLHWKNQSPLLDLCAAPGGKSAALLEQNPGAKIVCSDSSFLRLRRIHDARGRLGHRHLLPLVSDAARSHGQEKTNLPFKPRFQSILIDAPCSNLGVLSRRPEARWSHSEGDLKNMGRIQSQLLFHAATTAAAGAVIVYATCSPEPEETNQVVNSFLQNRSNWKLDPAEKFIPSKYIREGCLHVYPGEQDCDGFFAARLIQV